MSGGVGGALFGLSLSSVVVDVGGLNDDVDNGGVGGGISGADGFVGGGSASFCCLLSDDFDTGGSVKVTILEDLACFLSGVLLDDEFVAELMEISSSRVSSWVEEEVERRELLVMLKGLMSVG